MKIKKNNKAARKKSFLARHKCSTAGLKQQLDTGPAKLGVKLLINQPLNET